jgi:hypothetical protein
MALKLFRLVWFLSVLVLLATLLYGYAGWQPEVIVQDDLSGRVVMTRDALFYTIVGSFLIINVLIYLMRKMFKEEEAFRAWFQGLIITINIFLIIAINLVGLYNSTERFDYDRIGVIIYGSIALIIGWAVIWPIYILYKKFYIKQIV